MPTKIPAILDPDGPGGVALPLFESGAILFYLAEKIGQFPPRDPAARYQTLQWLAFQEAGALVGIADYPQVTRSGSCNGCAGMPDFGPRKPEAGGF